MGVSGTLELGFAEALGRPIYSFSDEDPEPVRKVLFDETVKTPKQLLKRLR